MPPRHRRRTTSAAVPRHHDVWHRLAVPPICTDATELTACPRRRRCQPKTGAARRYRCGSAKSGPGKAGSDCQGTGSTAWSRRARCCRRQGPRQRALARRAQPRSPLHLRSAFTRGRCHVNSSAARQTRSYRGMPPWPSSSIPHGGSRKPGRRPRRHHPRGPRGPPSSSLQQRRGREVGERGLVAGL
jgi:hypothetical protein